MLRSSSQQHSLLSMNRSYSRIYAVLMNTAKKPVSAQPVIENLPTQQTIAMMATVSRETVSRAIQALLKMGVVTKDTKRLIVQDVATLEKLARGEADISELQAVKNSA
jgi:CRP/FNR family cyclic AMP-dependent transcriptional regulator